MKRLATLALVGGLLAPAGAALGQEAGTGSGQPATLRHMNHAISHLLEGLRTMRQGPPWRMREGAMESARQALMSAQQARAIAVEALGLGEPVEDNPSPAARAAFQAILEAQDLAADGDRARVRYAIERAGHAVTMAGLNRMEQAVVETWLDEAGSALRRGDRAEVRRALEQAEWGLRANLRMAGPLFELGR